MQQLSVQLVHVGSVLGTSQIAENKRQPVPHTDNLHMSLISLATF